MIGARAMSQLDLHIEQKIAQRDSIDLAARRLAGRPGWVIEFGLGRGRSYAHLVERFPDREIYCFDRQHAMDPGGPRPPTARLILGDLAAVLADATVQARFRARVILAHLDLAWGEGDDATVHRLVLERTREWLLPGAWILSDRAVPLDPAWGLVPVPVTAEVGHAHRYHRYELRAAP
jgi:trans-aconitate methyltransferase